MPDYANKRYNEITQVSDLLDKYSLFLFDIWGVVLENDTLYNGILDTLNYIISQKKVMFISNTPRTKGPTYKKLKNCGLNVNEEMFVTAGDIAQKILMYPAQYFNITEPVIYNLGAEHNQELWQEYGFQITKDIYKANLMVISLSSTEQNLSAQVQELFKIAAVQGIPAICTNNDRIAPVNGYVLYCAGWFAEKFEELGGKVTYCGKPFSNIFLEVFTMHPDIGKNEILMIGDTLDTDIKGASNIGIKSALVTTGNMHMHLRKAKSDTEKLSIIENLCLQHQTYPSHVINLVL